MSLMTHQEGIDILKQDFPIGIQLGPSAIQRKLRWGYNRARHLIEYAIETKQAEAVFGTPTIKFI